MIKKGKSPKPTRTTQFNLVKNLGQNGRLSYDLRTSVKKGHNFSYVNRSPILERTRNLVLLTKIWNDGNLLQGMQSSLHTTSVIYLDTAVHATNDECQTLQIPALKASSEWPTRGAMKLDNPYNNSNLRATTSPVKGGEPRNEVKFLPRVRAWDTFSVKHPLMNHRYLLVRRGQKLDKGHNGTTGVAIAFCRLR